MPFFLQSLVALCRFLAVEILWHFYTYFYTFLYGVIYVWRLWGVFRVHPMMCLGSTEGWRRTQRNELDTLWWYCFANIAPTELLNMRIACWGARWALYWQKCGGADFAAGECPSFQQSARMLLRYCWFVSRANTPAELIESCTWPFLEDKLILPKVSCGSVVCFFLAKSLNNEVNLAQSSSFQEPVFVQTVCTKTGSSKLQFWAENRGCASSRTCGPLFQASAADGLPWPYTAQQTGRAEDCGDLSEDLGLHTSSNQTAADLITSSSVNADGPASDEGAKAWGATEWSWSKVPRHQKPVTFTFLDIPCYSFMLPNVYMHMCIYYLFGHQCCMFLCSPMFSYFCLKDIKLPLGPQSFSHSVVVWSPSSGDVQMMQIPQGLMPPNQASVVQKPVMIQQPLNTSSRLQIKPLPQTLPTPVTTTFHSLTAGQSIPSLRTERSEELPGSVKLNQGVESLEPSGLASASKSFFR